MTTDELTRILKHLVAIAHVYEDRGGMLSVNEAKMKTAVAAMRLHVADELNRRAFQLQIAS